MIDPFAALPVRDPACRASVAIPARNEARDIAETLASLVGQRTRDGAVLAPPCFEIVVYANGCTDATADVVDAFAARHPGYRIFAAAADPPASLAHIGHARRAVMDACAARMLPVDGAVLTTDADTRVTPTWLDETRTALAEADAVVGRIVLPPAVLEGESPAVRAILADESAYHFAVARAEAALDALRHDPWPRHWQQFGASFAVRAATYARIGGVPAVERLEDVALYTALLRADARVRHSLRVRVETSARRSPRVVGGFGTHLEEIRALADEGRTLVVESPLATYRRIAARGIARRYHGGDDALLQAVAEAFGSAHAAIAARRRLAATGGAFVHDLEIEADARGAFGPRDEVAIDAAAATLRRYVARFGDAVAAPTRASAASGAG